MFPVHFAPKILHFSISIPCKDHVKNKHHVLFVPDLLVNSGISHVKYEKNLWQSLDQSVN